MKNLSLILSVFVSLFFSLVQAQSVKESYRKFLTRPIPFQVDTTTKSLLGNVLPPTKQQKPLNGSSLSRIPIGKSADITSVLHSEQRCLSFDEFSNSMHFAFTTDPNTYPEANGKGSVAVSFAEANSDFEYWTDPYIMNPSQGGIKNPSAVVINPNNNHDPEDLYSVISGPYSLDGTNWSQSLFSSIRLDETAYHESLYDHEGVNDIARSNMTEVDGDIYIFGQDYVNVGDFAKQQTLKQYKGVSDNPADGFSWSQYSTISPDWFIDPDVGFAYALYTTWSAWRKDGSIGYMWMIGVTNDTYETGVFQPQVYYTLDKGDSWNKIDLELEDHPVLLDYIAPYEDENGAAVAVRPSFLNGDRDYPGVVDASGRLHLFASVYGSTRGDVLNPDDSIWVDPDALGGHIFSFIIDKDGIDDIFPVAEIKTKVSTDLWGGLGLDHQLQVVRSEDADVVIAVWADDVLSGSDSLRQPDVFSWSSCYGTLTSGPENLTEGTLYESFYYYINVAEYSRLSNNMYGVLLPLTTSVSPNEYGSSSPLDPITHYFVSGVTAHIHPACIENIKEENEISAMLSISQNTPNPFNEKTRIIVESGVPEAKVLSIKVSDISGHIVYSSDEGILYNYKEIVLDASLFEKGLYFYTISVDDISTTKKMLVE